MAGTQVNYDGNTTWIVRAARQVAALAERYPRAIRGVTDVLSVALVVAFRSGYTFVALALYLLAFVAWAKAEEVRDWWWRRRHPDPDNEPECGWDPEDWFVSICNGAHIHPPLVLKHWPTEAGHGYYVLVTHDVGTDKAPITVEAFAERASLLRDVAGLGCRSCMVERDASNGGRATVYFNGVRLEEWWPDVVEVEDVDPTTEIVVPAIAKLSCSVKGCDELPTVHVVTPEMPNLWVCANHVDPAVVHLGGEPDWHDFDEECHYARCLGAPSSDEADRKRLPDSDPLLPLHLRGTGPREGSGEGVEPIPALPPPDPATKRPAGAEPGTRPGRMFDLLAHAQGPLRRGTLAEHAELSPTYVDKLLTSWADIGAVERVGSLWMATTSYRSSGMFSTDGQEDDDS